MEQWGWRRALYWAVMHFLHTRLGFSLNYVMVGADSDDTLNDWRPEVPEGYETRIVALDDMLPFADTVPNLSRDFLETAFARGDECAANFYRGELIGFGFVSRWRAPVTEQLDVLVPGGFRMEYKAWVHPDHRRLNLKKMQHYARLDAGRPWFEERTIWYVETHNYRSLLHNWNHPRWRYLRMGFVGWFTLFGRQYPFRSHRARWITIEFVPKDDFRVRQFI